MKAIIGKKIGDVKVTRVVENTVYYTKHYWSGSFRRSVRCNMEMNDFEKLYPKNVTA